jgi:hypothetical protein
MSATALDDRGYFASRSSSVWAARTSNVCDECSTVCCRACRARRVC